MRLHTPSDDRQWYTAFDACRVRGIPGNTHQDVFRGKQMDLFEACWVRGTDEVAESSFGSGHDIGTWGASRRHKAGGRVQARIIEGEASVDCYALSIRNRSQKRDGNEA